MIYFLLALGHLNFHKDSIALEATDRDTEKFLCMKPFSLKRQDKGKEK